MRQPSFSGLHSDLIRDCVVGNLGYELLGEANRLLVEDDVEGLESILAKEGQEKRGVMLVFACVHGASKCTTYLVKQGAMQDVDMAACGQTLRLFTPITVAALLRHWEVVDVLMEGGAEAHAVDSGGFSAVSLAARFYPGSNLKSLLRLGSTRRRINTASPQGSTPLLEASASAVPLLVEAGADVNLVTGELTPLLQACYTGCFEKLDALVECGADVRHASTTVRKVPLMLAAEKGHVDIVGYLLGRRGVNIEAKTASGARAVDLACRGGHLEVVKVLVAVGTRVNPLAGDEITPLMEAAHGGSLQVVKYLVEEAGAKEWLTGPSLVTPLMAAAEKGRAEIVAYLLGRRGVEIDAKTAKGMTALDLACSQGHLDVVKLLVGSGARVGAQASDEHGPLAAAASGGHLQVVKYLVEEAGADERSAESREGTTPLIWAADKGHIDIVAYLLGRRGVPIDTRTAKGWTALDFACLGGHPEVVKLLVGAGAAVESQDSDSTGGTLGKAVVGGSLEVVDYLVGEAGADVDTVMYDDDIVRQLTVCDVAASNGRWDLVLCLVDHGADLGLCTGHLGNLAAKSGDESLVERLVDAGLKVMFVDKDGMTPLHTAACGSLPVVKLLVKARADIEARTPDGRTPLMCAAAIGKLDIVQWLVEAGADLTAKDKRGRTAWKLARSGRQPSVADYLQAVISQREHEALKVAEERAAVAVAALLEEEERVAAAKEASTRKRKKKGKKKGGAAAPPHTPFTPAPEQEPTSTLEASETTDDTQVMTAALSSLDLGQEATVTGREGQQERDESSTASVAPTVPRISPAEHLQGGSQGPVTSPGNTAAATVAHGLMASLEDPEDEACSMVVTSDELSCPISLQLMTDPVMADDGHTYQRNAIEEWINKCISGGRVVTSPLTGADMGSTLRPNLFARSLVRGRKMGSTA